MACDDDALSTPLLPQPYRHPNLVMPADRLFDVSTNQLSGTLPSNVFAGMRNLVYVHA